MNRKHLKLIVIAVFFLGLAAGAVGTTTHLENDFSHYNWLHILLIFSSGASMGAIITRIRYERKMQDHLPNS